MQQLEALEKFLISTQTGILASNKLIASMEQGVQKEAAKTILAEFKKSDDLMRKRLFILQVWRKFDQATADEVAKRKAGEYLDEDLAKVLEEKRKRDDRRDREREKERSRGQGKRFKRSPPYTEEPRAGSSNARQYQGRGGQAPRGGRGGPSGGGRKERTCYTCGALNHFARDCLDKK